MTDAAAPRTVLAFDFGLRRIGVAAGQTITGSATPLRTLVVTGDEALERDVRRLLREWRPDLILLGLPLRDDGGPTIEDRIKAFGMLLESFGVRVEYVDEALSSIEASERLVGARRSGHRRRIRKEDIDAEAARIIAERWLAQRRGKA